jgi:hypothetical protein
MRDHELETGKSRSKKEWGVIGADDDLFRFVSRERISIRKRWAGYLFRSGALVPAGVLVA